MLKMNRVLYCFVCLLFISNSYAAVDTIKLADPTIFLYNGTYYLYGTGGSDGFLVYTSKDLVSWSGPAGVNNGYALIKGQSYGTQGFWAPQVIRHSNKFYMAYTANEHIAMAESNSPLGPFTQKNLTALPGDGKQIDPYVFIDDDGKKYLYHVRLQNGNRIFVARLKDDFSSIEDSTLKECISASEDWENTEAVKWPVAEGPSVLKHQGLYYIVYSANDFRNIHYAVGYAVSNSPYGPWKKYAGNPIISSDNIHHNGSGHGDFLPGKKGELNYVFHVHTSQLKVSPRKTAIVKINFRKEPDANDKIVADTASFRYLIKN